MLNIMLYAVVGIVTRYTGTALKIASLFKVKPLTRYKSSELKRVKTLSPL
jgi:hypothetical protein